MIENLALAGADVVAHTTVSAGMFAMLVAMRAAPHHHEAHATSRAGLPAVVPGLVRMR
ncbi:hypothetical protein [Lentzea sp. NPDC059081]|uniref:hypothetical protein n=1 Tax=Lentzea sp. NPDC059081 TaxID=3346719 RepID=UPI003679B712